MLKNSRVSRTPDMTRLGNALSRPGMDTRVWASLAIVERVHVDAEEGVFVDVMLMPSRERSTARLGTEYAGNGFGMYAPVMVDDEVLVEVPNGDPDQGMVVTRRLHSASDPPPEDVVDHPEDVLLHIRSGKSVRIVTEGAGDVIIDPRGSGVVKLGGEEVTDLAVKGSTYRVAEDTLLNLIVTALTALQTATPTLTGTPAQIAAYAAAMTALVNGLASFTSGASSYLTTKVKL